MNTHHRITSSLAATVVLALGVAAAPASALIPYGGSNGGQVNSPTPPPCGDVCSGHGYGVVDPQPTIVPVSSPDGGFDWGDAGIGAAGGVALSMLGLGGALVASQRRTRSTPA